MEKVSVQTVVKLTAKGDIIECRVELPSYENLRSYVQLPDGRFACTVDVDADECTDGALDAAKMAKKYGRAIDLSGVVI